MKQKTTKSLTRSKSASRNGSAGNDTNKRRIYRVSFTYKQCGDRFIEAMSAEDAQSKAASIPTAEKRFWRDSPQEFTIIEIDAIQRAAMPRNARILRIPG